jgi:hypothetical protein
MDVSAATPPSWADVSGGGRGAVPSTAGRGGSRFPLFLCLVLLGWWLREELGGRSGRGAWMLEDSPCLEWWEEAEWKAEEEEEEDNEMLEEQDALLESFATTHIEERTRGPWHRPSAERPLHAYRPAHSFLSEDSPRLRWFGRPLGNGARPLRAKHHALRKVKSPPPPSSSFPQTTRSDVLY